MATSSKIAYMYGMGTYTSNTTSLQKAVKAKVAKGGWTTISQVRSAQTGKLKAADKPMRAGAAKPEIASKPGTVQRAKRQIIRSTKGHSR